MRYIKGLPESRYFRSDKMLKELELAKDFYEVPINFRRQQRFEFNVPK
jgi:hypothetical protein